MDDIEDLIDCLESDERHFKEISSKQPCFSCCERGYQCPDCNGTGFVGEGKELSSDMELEILNKGVEILKKYGMVSVASYIEKITPVIRESGVNKGKGVEN